MVDYCRSKNIIVQAYSPLAQGKRLNDPALKQLALKHGKTPAQVLIRYCLQKDWVPLPRSESPERIKENLDVFGFELDEEDMGLLNEMDEGARGAVFRKNVD